MEAAATFQFRLRRVPIPERSRRTAPRKFTLTRNCNFPAVELGLNPDSRPPRDCLINRIPLLHEGNQTVAATRKLQQHLPLDWSCGSAVALLRFKFGSRFCGLTTGRENKVWVMGVDFRGAPASLARPARSTFDSHVSVQSLAGGWELRIRHRFRSHGRQ